MRHQVKQHEFEVLFHVGVPLVVCVLVFTRLQDLVVARAPQARAALQTGVVAVAFALFVASAGLMGRVGDDAETRAWERDFLADVQAIRRHTPGKVVYVPLGRAGSQCVLQARTPHRQRDGRRTDAARRVRRGHGHSAFHPRALAAGGLPGRPFAHAGQPRGFPLRSGRLPRRVGCRARRLGAARSPAPTGGRVGVCGSPLGRRLALRCRRGTLPDGRGGGRSSSCTCTRRTCATCRSASAALASPISTFSAIATGRATGAVSRYASCPRSRSLKYTPGSSSSAMASSRFGRGASRLCNKDD